MDHGERELARTCPDLGCPDWRLSSTVRASFRPLYRIASLVSLLPGAHYLSHPPGAPASRPDRRVWKRDRSLCRSLHRMALLFALVFADSGDSNRGRALVY